MEAWRCWSWGWGQDEGVFRSEGSDGGDSDCRCLLRGGSSEPRNLLDPVLWCHFVQKLCLLFGWNSPSKSKVLGSRREANHVTETAAYSSLRDGS